MVPSHLPVSVTPLDLLCRGGVVISDPIPNPIGSTSPSFSSCSRTSENPRSQARSPAKPGAPVGGMYGVDAKGEPCVSEVLAKGDDNREWVGAEDGADEKTTGVAERGRPDGNNETRLDEMRERVACAGCDGVDANGDFDGAGEGAMGSDVVDSDGGEALPLRRGGSGTRAREGLGATLTLPPRSTLISLGLCISEASASARASSVDVGVGIGIGIEGGGGGWVLRKYMGSSWWSRSSSRRSLLPRSAAVFALDVN